MMGTSNSVGGVKRAGVGVSPEAALSENHPLSQHFSNANRAAASGCKVGGTAADRKAIGRPSGEVWLGTEEF